MAEYIDDNIIEKLRDQMDIVQVISDYLHLKKAGANYKGLCPFHNEKTPSFVVSPEKQIYHCFGCGEGGNVFSFVMKLENFSFPEAVRQLAEKHGIRIPATRRAHAQKEKADTIEQLYYINLAAAKYYHRILTEMPQGEPAREYLKNRNVSEKTISKFLLGFAPFAWDLLVRQLRSQGFPLELVARSTLIKERSSDKGYYDTFRSRIIFPIQNVRGKIVAFGGRLINSDDTQSPKYLNSSESPIYEKGANLYGLNSSSEQIRKQKNAIIVEGYMDLITAHQAGIGNVVATLGTALTRRQAKLLKRFTPQVTLVFDADAAGRAAAERGHAIFLEEGLQVKAASLPSGSDPDSFIRQQGPEAFISEITDAKPLMEFIIDNAIKEHDTSDIQGKVDCVNSVLPFLARIDNSVERREYAQLLSERASAPEEDILSELRRSGLSRKKRTPSLDKNLAAAKAEKNEYTNAEKELLPLLLHQKKILEKYAQRLKPAIFKQEEHRQVLEALLELSDKEENLNLAKLIDMLESDEAKHLVSSIMMQKIDLDDWQRAAADCIKLLEERAAEPGVSTVEKLNKATLELKEAERKGENIGPLLKKLQDLRSRLQSEGGERQLIRLEHP